MNGETADVKKGKNKEMSTLEMTKKTIGLYTGHRLTVPGDRGA